MDYSNWDNLTPTERRNRWIPVLEKYMDVLKPREEIIIRMRFGIKEDRCYTLSEIGKQLNISGSRVRQIQEIALLKILRRERRSTWKHYQ